MSGSPIAAPLQERAVVREQWRADAQAALASGNTDRAIEVCRAALEVEADDPELVTLYAVALHRSGQTEEGAALLAGLVRSNPAYGSGHANLGELQRQSGDFEAAIQSLSRASALDPENPLIHFNLGRTYQDTGANAEAAASYRTALRCNYGFVPAHRSLVRVLKDLVEPGEAELENRCRQLAGLRALDAKNRDYGFRLRSTLQGVRRAVRFGATDPAALLVLGELLLDFGEIALAIAALEKALDQPGVHADAYVALSMAYAEAKKWQDARAMTARFARAHPIGSRASPDPEANVLVLEALYNPVIERPSGVVDVVGYGPAIYARRGTISLVPPGRASYHHCYIDGIDPASPGLEDRYDVIYNNIGFAEVNLRRNYKEAINRIVEATGLTIVNRPEAVDAATRAANYRTLRDLDHAIFPKTLSYPVNALDLERSIDSIASEFTFPVLARTRIHGAGRSFHKADDVAELREVFKRIEPNGKEPVYVIQFLESKHASGAYLRYRAVFVDGVLYPGTMELSDTWLPARGEPAGRDRAKEARFMDDERRWLDAPETVIGPENLAALHAANARLGLDILGMDIGLADDGRVIIFEASPNVNALALHRQGDPAPYLTAASRRIVDAIEDLVIAKARHGPAPA